MDAITTCTVMFSYSRVLVEASSKVGVLHLAEFEFQKDLLGRA